MVIFNDTERINPDIKNPEKTSQCKASWKVLGSVSSSSAFWWVVMLDFVVVMGCFAPQQWVRVMDHPCLLFVMANEGDDDVNAGDFGCSHLSTDSASIGRSTDGILFFSFGGS